MRTSRMLPLLLFGLAASAARAQESEFKLVVHGSNAVSSLTRAEAAQYFLKKKPAWPGGQAVLPVDQVVESPARRAFSKAVLSKDVSAVKSYWQTQIFSGRGVPPAEKPSDVAVLDFVQANAGAIGYVSAGAAVGRGVKEVRLN